MTDDFYSFESFGQMKPLFQGSVETQWDKKKDFMRDLKNEENIDDLIRRFFPSKSSEK
jgi:hypothetical protein